jgi:hypothetical protein
MKRDGGHATCMQENPLNSKIRRLAFLMAAVTWSLCLPHLVAAADKQPNIVFILTDNLGYGEPGVYGGGMVRGAPTPRIDQLAAEGLRLTNFNVEAQCTPSRSAIMTGRFAIRSGTHSIPLGGQAERADAMGSHAGKIAVRGRLRHRPFWEMAPG